MWKEWGYTTSTADSLTQDEKDPASFSSQSQEALADARIVYIVGAYPIKTIPKSRSDSLFYSKFDELDL